ncbi:MAG: U32 family peptidase [Planctomycetota bacterium]
MHLAVATNWSDDLVAGLSELGVAEVYGSLSGSLMGSGRPASALPEVACNDARRHIELAHRCGMEFTYLVNAPCIDTLASSRQGRVQIQIELKQVVDLGVDAICVSIPLLLEVMREHFPRIRRKVSVIAKVGTVLELHRFRDLGAQTVTVDYMKNRDLATLAQMAREGGCELELVANEVCLLGCPYRAYHYCLTGHALRANAYDGREDYCLLSCAARFLSDESEYLRSPWIRPEDLATYEALGITRFKLADRCKSTAWLLRAARAYAKQFYEGNLLDILNRPLPFSEGELHAAPQSLRCRLVPQIENLRLSGFLSAVTKHGCSGACDPECRLCHEWFQHSSSARGDDGDRETFASMRRLKERILACTTPAADLE